MDDGMKLDDVDDLRTVEELMQGIINSDLILLFWSQISSTVVRKNTNSTLLVRPLHVYPTQRDPIKTMHFAVAETDKTRHAPSKLFHEELALHQTLCRSLNRQLYNLPSKKPSYRSFLSRMNRGGWPYGLTISEGLSP
jgi:hypothetical protein